MDLLGWSQIAMTHCYQHVVDELRAEAARRMGAALWGDQEATGGIA
jgi:hypothetical protein